MLKLKLPALVDLLTPAGFAVFFTFTDPLNPWLLLPAICFLLVLLKRPRRLFAAFESSFFSPYASGLLILPMRLFYWDHVDFANRVQNLLLLAAIFSIWLISRQQCWWKKILRTFNALELKKRLWLVFFMAEFFFIAASALITHKGVALVGDEPHYLAISQSLARDGDLNVFNQYFRDGFKEFLRVDKLAAHGTWGKGYKKIYSYHLPGISLTLTPFFYFKISPPLLYFLLRAFLGLFGAMLAVLVYLFCLRLWHSRSLAFFAIVVFSFSAPVFFYSFHIFPEVQAMLLVLSALYLLFFKTQNKDSRCLWAGLLLGVTIFWGVKYALFIYPICLGFFAYWLWQKKFRPALLLMAFPLLFQALFFYYLYNAYGNFSPNSVYYGMLSPEATQALYETILNKITMTMRWETLLDYFFDQRDGLLLYNPFYFFAFPGLLLALKNFKRYRLYLLSALPAVIFVINHAASTIRPGYCPQGRYLTPVVWVLLLFALIYYRESRNSFFKKMLLATPLYTFFIIVFQTLNPMTLYQPTTHDTLIRPGLLFADWSNVFFNLPGLLPSYIKIDNSGYLPNFIFLALFLLLLTLSFIKFPRRRVHGFPLIVFLTVFSLSSLFPRPDLTAPRKLTDDRGYPGRIYFSPQPTEQIEDQTWIFSTSEKFSMIIESRRQLKNIALQLQNTMPRGTLQLAITAFEEKPLQRQLQAAESARINLQQPPYKKIKNRYFYQLHMQGKVPPAVSKPSWRLRIRFR
ncbi:MAG: hypothetical protein JXI33_07715 [Candidatus Aminicenantes bacterium]|nr:hypothetical protein [Candidatus Aminicenantes bacterium]